MSTSPSSVLRLVPRSAPPSMRVLTAVLALRALWNAAFALYLLQPLERHSSRSSPLGPASPTCR